MSKPLRGNSTLFYATTFDVYPDDPKYDIWPCIIEVFQNWIVNKEKKKAHSPFGKHGQKEIDISTLAKWSSGMRTSAHTALLLRSRIVGSIEDWTKKNTYKSRKKTRSKIVDLLQADICAWSENEEGEFLRPVCLSQSFVEGIPVFKDRFTSLETFSASEDPIPEYWAMDYVESDSGEWWRTWRTQVGITKSDIGVYTVVIQVSYAIDPTYLRTEVEVPLRNVPICVRDLLSVEGIACISGEDPLYGSALYVGKEHCDLYYSFEQFYSDLTKPFRALPLVVVSSDGRGVFPLNPDDIAQKLRGVAIVAALDRSHDSLDKLVENTFFEKSSENYPFRPLRDSVRIYFPKLDSSNPRDSRRHFIFTHEQLDAYGKDAIAKLASDVIASVARAFEYPENIASSCADIREIVDKRRREELAKKYRDLTSSEQRNDERAELNARYDKALKDLESANKARKAQSAQNEESKRLLQESRRVIEEKDKELDELSEYAELLEKDLESTADQNRILKNEKNEIENEAFNLRFTIDSLKGKLEQKELTNSEIDPYRGMEEIPSTVEDSLKLAQDVFSDRLVVLPQALDSARKHDSGDAGEAWKILRGLALEMFELCLEQDNGTQGFIGEEFYARTGFKVSFRDTKATKNHASYKRSRNITYSGEEYDISPHVKGKSGSRNETLRVHFAVSRSERKIIIGHCGAHLETAGTKRKGLQ